MAADYPDRFITSSGARLWTTLSGSGTPLLLFNGGPGCDDYLEPVAKLIEERCCVVRFEPRGCGRSDWDGKYDLDTLLGDAEAIREAYGFERWIVAGHSHGVNVALAYASRHGARTIGVVGIAGGKALDDRAWSDAYHAALRSVGEDLGGKVFRMDADTNREGNASWRAFCRRPSMFRELADLKVPCVFINAGEDIRPNWPTQQLGALIPNARYLEIAGAKHYIWLTHAAELREKLLEAIGELQSLASNSGA